jgi:hypothetical protein
VIRVCLACGKVEGEHRGWDVSCHLNSIEIEEAQVTRDPETTRVVRIDDPAEVRS